MDSESTDNSDNQNKNELTFLSDRFVDSLNEELCRCQDISRFATEMIRLIGVVSTKLSTQRLQKLVDAGYAQGLAKILSKSDKVIALDGKKAAGTSSVTVGGSTAKYFAPWTGKPQKENSRIDLLDKLERRGLQTSSGPNAVEKEFFGEVAKYLFPKKLTKRNTKLYIHPSIPYVHATPDGFLYKNAIQKEAPIEVKECNNLESSGIITTEQAPGHLNSTLRKGHEWYTQLYLQMMATGLDKAYLAVKECGVWKVCSLELDPIEADKVAVNILVRYEDLLERIREEKTEDCKLLEPEKCGGARNLKAIRRKQKRCRSGMLTNLDFDPNGRGGDETVMAEAFLRKRDRPEDDEQTPFPN